jgi:hypothetical protein
MQEGASHSLDSVAEDGFHGGGRQLNKPTPHPLTNHTEISQFRYTAPPPKQPTRWVTFASGSRPAPVSMRSSTPLVANMSELAGPPLESSLMVYPTFSPHDSPRSAATRSATATGWWDSRCGRAGKCDS